MLFAQAAISVISGGSMAQGVMAAAKYRVAKNQRNGSETGSQLSL